MGSFTGKTVGVDITVYTVSLASHFRYRSISETLPFSCEWTYFLTLKISPLYGYLSFTHSLMVSSSRSIAVGAQ